MSSSDTDFYKYLGFGEMDWRYASEAAVARSRLRKYVSGPKAKDLVTLWDSTLDNVETYKIALKIPTYLAELKYIVSVCATRAGLETPRVEIAYLIDYDVFYAFVGDEGGNYFAFGFFFSVLSDGEFHFHKSFSIDEFWGLFIEFKFSNKIAEIDISGNVLKKLSTLEFILTSYSCDESSPSSYIYEMEGLINDLSFPPSGIKNVNTLSSITRSKIFRTLMDNGKFLSMCDVMLDTKTIGNTIPNLNDDYGKFIRDILKKRGLSFLLYGVNFIE